MSYIDDIAVTRKSCFTNDHLRLVKTFLKLDRKLKCKRLENARIALYGKAVSVLGIEKASVWNYRDNKSNRILVKAKADISPLVNLRVLPPVGSKASKNIQVVPLKKPIKKPDSKNQGKSTNESVLIKSVPTVAELQTESRRSPIRTYSSDFKAKLVDNHALCDTELLSDTQASESGSFQNESQEQSFSLKCDTPGLNKVETFSAESEIKAVGLVSENSLTNIEEPCDDSDEYKEVTDILNNITDETDGNIEDRYKIKEPGFFDMLSQFFRDFFRQYVFHGCCLTP